MFRTLTIIATIAVAALLVPGRATAEDPIKVGETFKGELTEIKGYPLWPGFVDTFSGYATEVPVKLRGGQTLSISGTVLGKDRKISIALLDPTGKIVAATKRNTAVKTVTLTAEEVSATGTYRIAIISDRVGDFTLRTSGPSDEELDAKKLEEEIKELKALLAKKEETLKKLKAKKKP